MASILRSGLPPRESIRLPDEVEELCEAGWIVGPGGSILLRDRWSGSRGEIAPSELGQYEYDVNDVYIPLSDLPSDAEDYMSQAAARGIHLAVYMLRAAPSFAGSETLVAVVAVFVDRDHEDFLLQGARVRFFTKRGTYPDWFEDLEGFNLQAIAVMDIADLDSQYGEWSSR